MSEKLRKARMVCLVRDGFRCQFPYCRERRLNRLTTHHLVPESEGGRTYGENLATLCIDHHLTVHQSPETVKAFREYFEARRTYAQRKRLQREARKAQEMGVSP